MEDSDAYAAGVSPNETLAYKETPQRELNLEVFYPEGHQPGDKSPAIVFFFGGGWKRGSPAQFYHHCEYLASRGMVAISAEYRVKERDGVDPQECVSDAKSAMRWVRSHATELGIDPDKIVAGGGSAGGHLAAATALVDAYDDEEDDLSVSCQPAALVLFNPVIDNGPDGYGYKRVKDDWETFSPMHNIDAESPPTVIFLGTRDRLIPVSTAEKYQERMEAAGVRCDVHLYEGMGHGFFNTKYKENYYLTLSEADRFLASLGYLEGEPTLEPPAPDASASK